VDLERFAALDHLRAPAVARTGRELSLAILARLVFEGNETEEAKRGLTALAEPVVRQSPAWTAGGLFGGPADWARLNYGLEAVSGRGAASWQRAARNMVRERQVASDEAEAVRGSWDPAHLEGNGIGRIRLAACCLGVLHYRCYDILRLVGPR
jgi:hypothetical protein